MCDASVPEKRIRKFINRYYKPSVLFEDCMERDVTDLPKDVDLYASGFPCQPFSVAGQMQGVEQKNGQVIFSILESIEHMLPNSFVLENVSNLLSFADVFSFIIKYLRDITNEEGDPAYEVHYRVLSHNR